jgi:hypothetical protein
MYKNHRSSAKKKTSVIQCIQEEPSMWMGMMLFVSLVGLMLFSGYLRFWYLVSLQSPLLIGCLLLLTPWQNLTSTQKRLLPKAKTLLFVLATLNLSMLLYNYYPLITSAPTRERIIDERAILITPWDYKQRKEAINTAYQACGFPQTSEVSRLVTDDYSYTTLRYTNQPLSFMYLTSIHSRGRDNFDYRYFFELLHQFDSSGILIKCTHVPPALKPFLIEENGYCCATLSKLPAPKAP